MNPPTLTRGQALMRAERAQSADMTAQLITRIRALVVENELSLRNVEALLYQMPVDCDRTELAALETWRNRLRAVLANARAP